MFSPKSIMMKEIQKGWLTTFPGLTHKLVANYLPDSSVTDMGTHLQHTRDISFAPGSVLDQLEV